MKGGYILEYLNVIGSCFQFVDATTEKACLPIMSLVLGIKVFF